MSKAITTEGQVIDVFTAAGLPKPDISILSDQFLAEVRGLKHKNVAAELLEKLLKDELKVRSKRNLVQSQVFSEKLKKTLNAYHNRAISTMQVIEELIKLAKDLDAATKRGENLGLTDDEVAFYDALAANDSAVTAMGDAKLKVIAAELITQVKKSVTIDWNLREGARAKIRVMVRRILNKHGYGFGTVFRLATNGLLTSLASFGGTNGWSPLAGVVEGEDGAFYGTTRYGGSHTNGSSNGHGTIFKVTTNGVLTSLASFAGTNGSAPVTKLVKGRNGLFYGTAASGGAAGWGTVFGVSSQGQLATLATLQRDFTGVFPVSGLVEGADGALYGTTTQGTFSPTAFGGTVFRVTTNGVLSPVYSFADADGRWPAASLTQGSDGAFYGTCEYWGEHDGGTVFRLDPTVQLAAPKAVPQGVELTFRGLPRTSYGLLRATNLSGPWNQVLNVIPGTNGFATGVDLSPPMEGAFYRTFIAPREW